MGSLTKRWNKVRGRRNFVMRGSYLGGGAVMGTKSSPSNRGKDEDIAPSGASNRKKRRRVKKFPNIGEQWGALSTIAGF